MTLRQHGFQAVWLATDGAEALDIYRRHRRAIDVVLVDVRMPRLDGCLRKMNPEVRCCFMTGEIGGYTEAELLAQGAVRVIRKPFRLTALVCLLQELAPARRG
jgi:CheY-like chemotaxis protein